MPKPTPRRYASGTVAWRVNFRVDGKQRQESFIEYDGAEEFGALVDKVGGAAALRVLDARRNNVAAKPTLRDWTEQYLDPASGLLTGVEDGTRKSYQGEARRSFLNTLGDYPVDAIDRDDVGKWLAWQEHQPALRNPGHYVAAKTVRNYHNLLSSVLSAAVERGHRVDNPAYKMRLKKGIRPQPVFLSPEQFETVMFFLPEYHKPLVQFLAATGTRWGEATAVTWQDLDLVSSTATVRINKAWKKGEGSPVLGHPKSVKANRSISIDADSASILIRPEGALISDLAFPGQMGQGHIWAQRFRATTWMPTMAKAMDKELCAKNGLVPLGRRPRIHDLRHTHASWLIAAGVPLPYVQARLGHEKITTTIDVYGHLVPDAHEQMADVIGRTMSGGSAVVPPTTPPLELEALDELVGDEILGEIDQMV